VRSAKGRDSSGVLMMRRFGSTFSRTTILDSFSGTATSKRGELHVDVGRSRLLLVYRLPVLQDQ
jgi:hypothetical protein